MTEPIESKSFDRPDRVREFLGKGRAEVVELRGYRLERHVHEPGWQWSVHVGPTAGSSVCKNTHLRYVISGRMRIRPDEGEEVEAGPGDLVWIEPGHDGWVVGDEACVTLDFIVD